MLVAPSEHALASIGQVSSLPEQYGADFLFITPAGLVGVQRKACPDLVASIQGAGGDRLGREVAMMTERLDVAILMVEGNWKWEGDRSSRRGCQTMTRARYRSLILTAQHNEGIMVVETTGLADTRETLIQYEEWFQDPAAHTLRVRPKPGGDGFVDYGESWQLHLGQSWPGVGRQVVLNAIEKFGRWPIVWDDRHIQGPKDWEQVALVGKKRAQELWRSLTT